MARINAQARTVVVDMFGPMPGFERATNDELAAFPAQEGVFFGNLFLPQPLSYACALDVVAQAEFRACEGGDCGVIVPLTGSTSRWGWGYSYDRYSFTFLLDCFTSKICQKGSLGGGYSYAASCARSGITWNYPITTHLAPAAPGEECYGTYQCMDGLSCVDGFCQ
jgi:hypothetical protein